MLKVDPNDQFEDEVATLVIADGDGCARVLRHDPLRRAALLERLGPPLASSTLTADEQLPLMCDPLQRLWPHRPHPSFTPLDEKGRWLIDLFRSMWDVLDRPCHRRTVELAIELAESRVAAFTTDGAVLLHGDPHAVNALADPLVPGAYRYVDPDGLFGEREYDLGIVAREWNDELLADADPVGLLSGRIARLAGYTGADADATAAWSFVERVSTGFWCLRAGMPDGTAFLRAADHLVAAGFGRP